MRKHKLITMPGLCILLCSLLTWTVDTQIQAPLVRAETLDPGEETSGSAIDWLEPRGLNIVDMVGFVPEEYLEGAIISYTPGYGILIYESGERVGNTITVTATVSTRYIIDDQGWQATMFGCLGQPARIDQWGSTSPPTTMRVYHDGQDVTDQINYLSYVPDSKSKPILNPLQSKSLNQYRYWESALLQTADWFTPDGALNVPANMGCEFIIEYQDYEQLTAVFVAQVKSYVSIEVVGTEELTFRSYNGAGDFGLLQTLSQQLSVVYGNRHDKFDLNVPAEADYFFLNFPTMPVDLYTAFYNTYDNIDRPSGGTYRIWGPSTDHVNTMGLPLHGQWRDMDRADNTTYLPYFDDPDRLSCPEYLVPAGVEYHPCMIYGGCSSEILDAVWNTPMTMTLVYLHVGRTSCDLESIPLRMVGPMWSPSLAASVISPGGEAGLPYSADFSQPVVELDHTAALTHYVYLPLVLHRYCIIPPDTCTAYPCGWFTSDGQMVDFIPSP
jgi:hypothetical protein